MCYLKEIKKFIIKLEKISSFLSVIVMIILVGVTIFYAWHTKQMASTMERQFSLSLSQFQQNNRPYLFLDDFEWGTDEWETDAYNNVLFTVGIKNSGGVPARVVLEKYSYIIDGKEYPINMEGESLSQGNLIVFPSSKGRVWRSLEFEEERRKLIVEKKKLKVILRFSYWAIGDEKKEDTFFYEQHIEMIDDPRDYSTVAVDITFIDAD